jgi:hypothetical protein
MSWLKDNVDPKLVEYLFRIRITDIPNIGVYQHNVADDLALDFEQLELQLEQVPEQIAFWNMLHAEQKSKVEILDRRIKTIRGQVTERLLKEARDSKIELRSNDLKEILNCDKGVLELDAQLLAQKKVLDKLDVVVDGFIRKFDALRSLAGFKKEDKRVHGQGS